MTSQDIQHFANSLDRWIQRFGAKQIKKPFQIKNIQSTDVVALWSDECW